MEHALLSCKAREIACKLFPIKWDGIEEHKWNFWDWWESMQNPKSHYGGQDHIEATADFLWQLWKARNEWTFNHIGREQNMIAKKAVKEWLEFKETDSCNKGASGGFGGDTELQNSGTFSAAQHTILIYSDAAVCAKRSRAGMGIAAKDWWGNIITTWASPVKAGYDASVLEAIAIRETLNKAVVENWASIVVLSNCKHVVEKIHQAPKGISPLDTIV